MEWLAVSLVLSIVLTVALNVLLRVFPNTSERAGRKLEDLGARETGRDAGGRTRVYMPWKAMIVVSLLATVALNVFLWFSRQ